MHGTLDASRVLREVERFDRLRRADILLLQEVDGELQARRDLLGGLGRAMDLPFCHVPADGQWARNGSGLAVLSRFPLRETAVIPLERIDLVYKSRDRIALAQTVATPLGDVRLFNLHLDSRVNPGRRVKQLSAVLDAAGTDVRPVIIGGDFNTGDFYWIGHVLPLPAVRNQRRALLGAMEGRGFQTPFESTGPTHDSLGLRLDWMFFRHLRAVAAGTQPVGFSDHHAIWAEVGPA